MFTKRLHHSSSSIQGRSLLRVGDVIEALLHLVFPHLCAGCGSDLLDKEHHLCLHCLSSLPDTSFHIYPDNPVEQIFYGRTEIVCATAQYYYTKESMMQNLMHQLKYKGHKELGLYLGKLMGKQLAQCSRFDDIDVLIPLPLYASREHKRGYNQAALLSEGIAAILQKPVLYDVVARHQHTETQTRKSRIERWQNMQGRFTLMNETAIEGKHVLLVDDIVTTGATLEACGKELLKAKNVRLSIGALCRTSN